MVKRVFLAVLALVLTATVTAYAVMSFSDQSDFPGWATDSIAEMSDMGVITGYSDGSFGPNNSVTRAEVAVMLDRFKSAMGAGDDIVIADNGGSVGDIDEMQGVLMAYAALEDIEMEDAGKMALALASHDMEPLDGPPVELGNDCIDVSEGLFEFWTVYRCDGIGSYYYVNFQYEGKMPESGEADIITIDEWYGSYFHSGSGIKGLFLGM